MPVAGTVPVKSIGTIELEMCTKPNSTGVRERAGIVGWHIPALQKATTAALASYAAASLCVPVSFVSSVDLPTEGKPTNPTRVSPALLTSKPRPPPPPPPLPPESASRSSL